MHRSSADSSNSRSRTLRPILPVLLTLLLLPGCGDEETTGGSAGAMGGKSGTRSTSDASSSAVDGFTPPTVPPIALEEIPSEIAALLPARPHAIIRLRSLDDARRALARLPGAGGSAPDPSQLFLMFPVAMQLSAANAIASDRPITLAVEFQMTQMGPFPQGVLVVPLADPTAADGLALGDQARVAGDSLCCTMGTPLPALGHPGLELPVGAVAMHIDFSAILAQYRPMIDGFLVGLTKMLSEGSSPEEARAMITALQPYLDVMTGMMDSARSYRLGIENTASGLAIHGHLHAAEGSPMTTCFGEGIADVWTVTGSIDADAPVSIAMVGDFGRLVGWMRPITDSVLALDPDPMAARMAPLLDRIYDFYTRLGKKGTFTLRTDADGAIHYDWLVAGADPQILDDFTALLTDPLLGESGVGVRRLDDVELDGAEARRFSFEFDFEKLAAGDPTTDPEAM